MDYRGVEQHELLLDNVRNVLTLYIIDDAIAEGKETFTATLKVQALGVDNVENYTQNVTITIDDGELLVSL